MRWAFRTIVLMALAVVGYFLWYEKTLTPQQMAAVNKLYLACRKEVDKSADELEGWYRSYTKGPTEKAASELLGWTPPLIKFFS